MFATLKELLNLKQSVANARAELESLQTKIEQRRQTLTDLQVELAQKENIIAERGNTIERIMREVTEDRERLLREYAQKENAAQTRLDELTARLEKTEQMMDDRERQVYCISSLYQSMRAAAGKYLETEEPNDIEMTPEELEKLKQLQQSVHVKMFSYQMEDLKVMHEANNRLIEQLLQRYEEKFTRPHDRVVFQLMTLAMRAELQLLINDMEYAGLDKAQVSIHLTANKYLRIVSFANLDVSELLTTYMAELEYLLKETLRIEHHYHLRKHDYEMEQEFQRQKRAAQPTVEQEV